MAEEQRVWSDFWRGTLEMRKPIPVMLGSRKEVELAEENWRTSSSVLLFLGHHEAFALIKRTAFSKYGKNASGFSLIGK